MIVIETCKNTTLGDLVETLGFVRTGGVDLDFTKIECEALRAKTQKGNLNREKPRLLIGGCSTPFVRLAVVFYSLLYILCPSQQRPAHSILHLSSQCIKYSAASNIK